MAKAHTMIVSEVELFCYSEADVNVVWARDRSPLYAWDSTQEDEQSHSHILKKKY